MKKKGNFFRCKRGLETVTAVFMMLLMFAAIVLVVFSFESYNSSIGNQMNDNLERTKGSVSIFKVINPNTNEIASIKITNTGTVETQVKALYVQTGGQTKYIDPTKDMDTNIAPRESLTIAAGYLSPNPLPSNTTIIASTDTGVQTIELPQPTPTLPPAPTPDPDTLTYGALMLRFSGFKYKDLSDPQQIWQPGWQVPGKTRLDWRVNVTNVGSRPLSLAQISCFTTVSDTTSSGKSWTMSTPIQRLDVGVSTLIVFTNPSEQIYSSGSTCMIFLTFYGNYIDDGTPYAQTIPFEAITVT